MKSLILFVCNLVISMFLFAQVETGGVRLQFGAASNRSIHIGSPLIGVNYSPINYTPNGINFRIGFPWGILFMNKTFSYDRFSISKGYFADRVELNWAIQNNGHAISNIEIYRTSDIDAVNPVWGMPIQILSRSATSFSDNNAETGKLYRYKVKAIGVISGDPDQELNNYLEGIGYRNATGLITGNVSYKGGSPVKDVLVSAVAEGSGMHLGKALYIPDHGKIHIGNINRPLRDSFTVQIWANFAGVRPASFLKLLKLNSNTGDSLLVSVGLLGSKLAINVGSAQYLIGGYFPNGKLNNKGEDTYDPIDSILNKYVHFTVVLKDGNIPMLYINGRPLTTSYFNYLNNLLPLGNSATFERSGIVPININSNSDRHRMSWNSVEVGGGVPALFDDLRVWERALSDQEIRTSYRRYLRGDENSLLVYLRFDENAGKYVYDLSFRGNSFNNNSGVFISEVSIAAWWSDNTPNLDQLGIFGITDANGNYAIAAIPYKGNGELYKITPSLGVHKFDPSQETLFIGPSSSVTNRVNFTDISSFKFSGRILYDSRGIFPKTLDSVMGDIKDNEAYNAYTIGNLKYPKGEYWAEMGTGVNANRIVKLWRYAPIPVEGANVFIDNTMVLDDNNNPVLSDRTGRFTIQVPIGKHSITVKKNGHIFQFNGRYPARDSIISNNIVTYTNTFKDFFEDNDEDVTFINNTKVTLVGRVVGGKIEASKPIGFGQNGLRTFSVSAIYQLPNNTATASSINNIGTAVISLGYRSLGATSITDEFKCTFQTNAATGEYRVDLLPLNYELNRNDLFIPKQNTENLRRFLKENQLLNFSEITPFQTDALVLTDSLKRKDTIARSSPFQYRKDFIYMALPEVAVLQQLYDTTITIGDSLYYVSNAAIPLYTQLKPYSIILQRQEKYFNRDNESPNTPAILNIVPASEGDFIINNSIALPGSERLLTDSLNPSITRYTFTAGQANTDITSGFERTIVANYRISSTDYPISGIKNRGIILGGAADGSTGFVTSGPDQVDIILRDPPGSGSSATISKGTVFEIETNAAKTFQTSTNLEVSTKLGVKFSLTGGLIPMPQVILESENNKQVGISASMIGNEGGGYKTSYSFSETISTSSNPGVVGADGDIYIGKATNYFYGLYDEIKAVDNPTRDRNNLATSIPIQTTRGVKYISKTKALSFTPDGTPTLFVYSQTYVINTLIPSYEDILFKIRTGQLVPNSSNNLKDSNYYKQSIDLWRTTIARNEAQKFEAFSDRDNLRRNIIKNIGDNFSLSSQAGTRLMRVLDEQFYRNISLDANVGSFSRSINIENVSTWTNAFEFNVSGSVGLETGATVNGAGFSIQLLQSFSGGGTSQLNQQVASTNQVLYTLADNDPYNVLSVDVINCFDGNGPVFILRGGASSCPVEEAQKSNFFSANMFAAYKADTLYKIKFNQLDPASKVELSKGSIPLEKPFLSVDRTSIVGVPETGKAEFKFTLSNTSQLEPAFSNFRLRLNPASNPNGAKLNIDAIGILITLNGSKSVQFTVLVEKGAADVFNYDSLEVVLESACDAGLYKSIFISAQFIQSCTKVDIARPSNNWVVNKSNAFNNGITIPLPIILNGYRTDYTGFRRIALQYRMVGTPSWTSLRNYVKDVAAKNIEVNGGIDSAIIDIITGSEITYLWNVSQLGLADGNYEIRAVSYCANGTIFETAPIQIKVDLSAPVLFGTTTPNNGILSIGENIGLRFSEPVKKNGTLSRVDFIVQDNQLPVDHSVALAFNGNSSVGTIVDPFIKKGSISVEFWLRNATSLNASIIYQENGIIIRVSNTTMTFSIGSQSVTADIPSDNAYHHYALAYQNSSGNMTIIVDDRIAIDQVKSTNLIETNNKEIRLGGSAFVGKLHDLRLWDVYLTREQVVANMYAVLNGNEDGLIGYWAMSEGVGSIAKDQARGKHISLSNINWDIFPNKESYSFSGTNHLMLSNVSKAVFSSTMDGTISFWFRTTNAGASTILSNGRGDSTDAITSSGFRNTWSFDLDDRGLLNLITEGKTFPFGSKRLTDGLWHHVAVVIRRKANMILFVDGASVQEYPVSGIGGFAGSSVFVGARGYIGLSNQRIVDQNFRGQIDELCIWNMARQADQINEDRYYEQDFENVGLILYAPFNKPEVFTTSGPKYWIPMDAQTKTSDYAILSLNSSLSYSSFTPPIKPQRNNVRLTVNAVVNNDQMILEPLISDWAKYEKKIAYITVANMFDMADNIQESPITWTAYVRKNPLKWYIEGYDDMLNVTTEQGKSATYQLVIVNTGGEFQNYSIELPSFLFAKSNSGVLSPNSQQKIEISINTNLSPGRYFNLIKLRSRYNFTEQIKANIRILKEEPEWEFNPSNFEDNMNIVGKVKINGIFSNDIYSKVVAYYLDSVRGIAPLVYDEKYDAYYVLMNVYGNAEHIGKDISFKIWDASDGILKQAIVDGVTTLTYQPNIVLGDYQKPVLFESTSLQTQILDLNKGWSWISFNVNDPRFSTVDSLFKNLQKSSGDMIKSYNPSYFDVFNVSPNQNQSGWFGTISLNGGIDTLKSYRIRLAKDQKLLITGKPISLDAVFNLTPNWNNLPYIASRNLLLRDALSGFDARDGDQIKSQTQFAIYDGVSKSWKGNLVYMTVGQGYMIKALNAQRFKYPSFANDITIGQSFSRLNYLNSATQTFGNNSYDPLPSTDYTNADLVVAFGEQPKLDAQLLRMAETMNMVAVLPAGYDSVKFYANTKMVSFSEMKHIKNRDLYFITLFGDSTIPLKAKLFRKGEIFDVAEDVLFQANNTVGTLNQPYTFNLQVKPLGQMYTPEMKIYPIPFSTQFNVELTTEQAGSATLILYDISGKEILGNVLITQRGKNVYSINPILPAGTYLLKLTSGSNVFKKFIIKQ